MTTRRTRPLGPRQIEILREAAGEVARACPWIPIESDRRVVTSLVDRGFLGATSDLFGIMPAGCRALRRIDHSLAMDAIRGLKRNKLEDEVLPWHV